MKERKKKSIIIGSLCAVLLAMVIGYAAFNSALNIKGISNVTSEWKVVITGVTEKTKTSGASSASTPTWEDLTANMKANLESPGDYIEYEVTIANQGSLDAKLESINTTDSNNPAIIFTTSGLEEGTKLAVGSTATLIVRIEYNSAVTEQPSNTNSNLTLTLDYVQSSVNSEGIAIPPTLNVHGVNVDVVESGDGLYASEYENGRYIYRGANPNNYITFNDEIWRIMSVESDGTLKIRKATALTGLQWDAPDNRDSSTSTYCTHASSWGCNVWAATDNLIGSPLPEYTQYNPNGNPTDSITLSGTVISDSTMNTYLNNTYYNTLSDVAKSYVVDGTFDVSSPGNYDDTEDMATNIEQAKQYQWKGKVALMTILEWMQTSTDTGCTTLSAVYNSRSKSVCSNDNWMFTSAFEWSLSPSVGSDVSSTWYVTPSGYSIGINSHCSTTARPVLYLTSNLTLSGSGTSSDPYTINS